jgi:hypothetical protein
MWLIPCSLPPVRLHTLVETVEKPYNLKIFAHMVPPDAERRIRDKLGLAGVPIFLELQTQHGDAILRAVRLAEGERWVIGAGDEAPARHEVVVDAPEHTQQLNLARRVGEQMDRSDQIEGAQRGERYGVAHLIRDAAGLRQPPRRRLHAGIG